MSEVAALRRKLEQEYQSMHTGLYGLCVAARHDFVARKYRQVEVIHRELVPHIGEDAALQMVMDIFLRSKVSSPEV